MMEFFKRTHTYTNLNLGFIILGAVAVGAILF